MAETLSACRAKINRIDEDLMKLLKERFVLTEQIGLYKQQKDIPIFDHVRESEMEELRARILQNNPHREYLETLWQAIVAESRRQQEELMGSNE